MTKPLTVRAEPVFYGPDRATVHIGRAVRSGEASRRFVSGYCQTSPGTMVPAVGRSVTCPDCLAHANRLVSR